MGSLRAPHNGAYVRATKNCLQHLARGYHLAQVLLLLMEKEVFVEHSAFYTMLALYQSAREDFAQAASPLRLEP